VRISQAEVGMLAGLSRQRTNEALNELRERRLVILHRLASRCRT
jgi:predicted transcriptional regulator